MLFLATCLPTLANDDRSSEARKAAEVKAAIATLGAGKDEQVALVLRGNERELIGFVQEAGEDSFQLGNFCTDDVTRVPYDQVKSLWGKDAVSGRKVSVGVGFFRKLRGTGDPTRDLHCGGTIVIAPPANEDRCFPPCDPVLEAFGVVFLVLILTFVIASL